MFVRHALTMFALLFVFGSHARADQEPSFVLSMKQPSGGNAKHHVAVQAAIGKREAELKPALLAKTKAHPKSRMRLTVVVQVQRDGSFKLQSFSNDWRTSSANITDNSIQPVVDKIIGKTPKLAAGAGITVETTIKILQP